MSFFPSLFDRPKKIKFAYQEEDEVIELLLRQHGITNVPWIVISIIGLLIPLLIPFITKLLDGAILLDIPVDIRLAITTLWYLFILAYIIEKFLGWYFNIYIVTNHHVVDVDFTNLLSRYITEVRLEDIESPRAKISGVIGSLFNFGDVNIETAARTQSISFTAIPKPDLVVDRIQDLQEGRA